MWVGDIEVLQVLLSAPARRGLLRPQAVGETLYWNRAGHYTEARLERARFSTCEGTASVAGERTKLRRFRGQVALVVGGAQGIGKAIALRLADEGARVVIGDVDRRELLRTGREMSGQGLDVRTVVCDVCNPRQVERMV